MRTPARTQVESDAQVAKANEIALIRNRIAFKNSASTRVIEIKDLMLGELLCQSRLISDQQMLHLVDLARRSGSTLGAVLVVSGCMSASELFMSRRLVNRYLQDQNNLERYLQKLRSILSRAGCSRSLYNRLNAAC